MSHPVSLQIELTHGLTARNFAREWQRASFAAQAAGNPAGAPDPYTAGAARVACTANSGRVTPVDAEAEGFARVVKRTVEGFQPHDDGGGGGAAGAGPDRDQQRATLILSTAALAAFLESGRGNWDAAAIAVHRWRTQHQHAHAAQPRVIVLGTAAASGSNTVDGDQDGDNTNNVSAEAAAAQRLLKGIPSAAEDTDDGGTTGAPPTIYHATLEASPEPTAVAWLLRLFAVDLSAERTLFVVSPPTKEQDPCSTFASAVGAKHCAGVAFFHPSSSTGGVVAAKAAPSTPGANTCGPLVPTGEEAAQKLHPQEASGAWPSKGDHGAVLWGGKANGSWKDGERSFGALSAPCPAPTQPRKKSRAQPAPAPVADPRAGAWSPDAAASQCLLDSNDDDDDDDDDSSGGGAAVGSNAVTAVPPTSMWQPSYDPIAQENVFVNAQSQEPAYPTFLDEVEVEDDEESLIVASGSASMEQDGVQAQEQEEDNEIGSSQNTLFDDRVSQDLLMDSQNSQGVQYTQGESAEVSPDLFGSPPEQEDPPSEDAMQTQQSSDLRDSASSDLRDSASPSQTTMPAASKGAMPQDDEGCGNTINTDAGELDVKSQILHSQEYDAFVNAGRASNKRYHALIHHGDNEVGDGDGEIDSPEMESPGLDAADSVAVPGASVDSAAASTTPDGHGDFDAVLRKLVELADQHNSPLALFVRINLRAWSSQGKPATYATHDMLPLFKSELEEGDAECLAENEELLEQYVELLELFNEVSARRTAAATAAASSGGGGRGDGLLRQTKRDKGKGKARSGVIEYEYWNDTHKQRSAPSLSASTLGRYYHMKCDLFLRLKMNLSPRNAGNEHLARLGVGQVEADITKLRLDGGQVFEDVLIDTKLKDSLVRSPLTSRRQNHFAALQPPLATLEAQSNEDAKVDTYTTLLMLARARPGGHLYQCCFKPPQSLVSELNLQGLNGLGFSQCFTDFLQIIETPAAAAEEDAARAEAGGGGGGKVGGGKAATRAAGRSIYIIDAKNSSGVSHTHQVQVAFYAIAIRRILKEQAKLFPSLRDLTVHNKGAIWLRGHATPTEFSLEMPEQFVLSFLKRKLKGNVLAANLEDVQWGLIQSCGSCDFYAGCKTRSVQEDSVCQVPGTSRRFKHFVDKHLKETGLKQLQRPEEKPHLLLDQRANIPTNIIADYFDYAARLRAQELGVVLASGRASATIPKFEACAVFVTIQKDPARGDLIGFCVSTLNTVAGGTTPELLAANCIANTSGAVKFGERPDANADHIPVHRSELGVGVVTALSDQLRHVDAVLKQSVQVYTFEEGEMRLLGDLLVSTVLDSASSKDMVTRAWQLYMTLFGDESCLTMGVDQDPPDVLAEVQGGGGGAGAGAGAGRPRLMERQKITVLFQEIKTMLAFPNKDVSVDFDTCWKYLCHDDAKDSEWYAEQMMGSCSTPWIVWNWLKNEDVSILCYGRTIIAAVILNGLRSKTFQHADPAQDPQAATLEAFGFLRKPKTDPFRFKESINIPNNKNVLVKKMLFVAQLETIEACNQAQALRLLPKNQRIFTGKAVQGIIVPAPTPLPADVNPKKADQLAWAQIERTADGRIPIGENDFPEVIVSFDSPDGDKLQLLFDDLYNFNDNGETILSVTVVGTPHVVVILPSRCNGSSVGGGGGVGVDTDKSGAAGAADDGVGGPGGAAHAFLGAPDGGGGKAESERILVAFKPMSWRMEKTWKDHDHLGMLSVGNKIMLQKVSLPCARLSF